MSPYTGGGGYLPLNWWLLGATVDLDFQGGRYYDSTAGGDGQLVTTYLSCSRASTGTAQDNIGNWISFANDTLRITNRGILVEDTRTNNLLNSDAPATQTTASLSTGSYTLWVNGSGSALASAGSATISGAASATDGNPNTFTVTGAGTVVVTVTGSLTRFQLEKGAWASSYIPTTGATATRAAEVVTFLSTASTILVANAEQTGVVDVKSDMVIPASPNGDFPIIGLAPGVQNDYRFGTTDNTHGKLHYGGIGEITANPGGSGTFSGGVKGGWSQSINSSSLCINGGTVATGAFSNSGTPAQIGGVIGNDKWYGYVRRCTLWNTRLSDSALQAFTV